MARSIRIAGRSAVQPWCAAWWPAAACLALCGCVGPFLQGTATTAESQKPVAPDVQLVGSVAHPYGMTYTKIENVALVSGLPGTGEDPPPSPQRAAMLSEMHRREIENPNAVLASPATALVMVRGFLRPGIRAGERFDVEVRTPSRSDAKSLRGGYLLETRLTETAILGEQLRKGHVLALAQGAILVDPSADPDEDRALATRGLVLSGGVATKDRELGLILDHENRSYRLSQSIAQAINLRFSLYVDGRKSGVANPKTPEFIELALHPRYQDNVSRYMRVVRSIAVQESTLRRQARLTLLREQLLDPVTASAAALRLEAIGDDDAVAVLEEGAIAGDGEVRFYSAEALAYLDRTSAVDPLAKAAIDEPAYRINALAAMSAMKDGAAYHALRDMLPLASAETRYGAFRALWTMDATDPLVRGVLLGGKFRYHQLDVDGDPLIHATS
ncbi:MAG: flagellar basal body P-ring protein FlgI, partial [Planctomycetales bacterium]|nr:flagellar basal body P-ring protein FlgI [Planctomycetales bacterium]